MTRIIVAAGDAYADIDVLACAVAYAELLRLEGNDAVAVVSPTLNSSITPTVLSYGAQYATTYEPHDDDAFVMVDISEPKYFASFVDHARIREVYDHRFFGHEKQWQEMLGADAHIERVGSCATLIWEQVQQRGFADALSLPSKQLIITAIVSNTLNFKASVTDERDRRAYADLHSRAGLLSDEWITHYFAEQEENIARDLPNLLRADTKMQPMPQGEALAIGQLELLNASAFVHEHADAMAKIMQGLGATGWFVTLPSINEGKNYLFTTDTNIQALLAAKLNVTFNNNIAETKVLMMRKEVIPMLVSI